LFETKSSSFPSSVCRLENETMSPGPGTSGTGLSATRKDLGEPEMEEDMGDEEEAEEEKGERKGMKRKGREGARGNRKFGKKANFPWRFGLVQIRANLFASSRAHQTMWKDQASENTQKRPRLAT
jgi:hypothetical protein